jgi:hypothetical protein
MGMAYVGSALYLDFTMIPVAAFGSLIVGNWYFCRHTVGRLHLKDDGVTLGVQTLGIGGGVRSQIEEIVASDYKFEVSGDGLKVKSDKGATLAIPLEFCEIQQREVFDVIRRGISVRSRYTID